ncbi:Palmitoyltransferase [Entamoeba marina]
MEMFLLTLSSFINAIDPQNVNYKKYVNWVGPERRVYRRIHSNTSKLETNFRDSTTFIDPYNSLDFCLDCGMIKWPRVTHCNNCEICILRYDHHSYFFNTCIGQHNFLLYYLCILISMSCFAWNSIIAFLIQFTSLNIYERICSLIFLGLTSCLFVFLFSLSSLYLHGLQYNYTQSEKRKFIRSREKHYMFHYDTGNANKNIKDAMK